MTNVVNHNNLPNKDLNLSSEQHSQVEEKHRVPVGKDYTIFFIKKNYFNKNTSPSFKEVT